MKIDVKTVMITTTLPVENAEEIKKAICEAGAGVIGEYTNCTISYNCIGTFKPINDANPYIGKKNKLETVEEEKIETVCSIDKVNQVILNLRKVHPYEEPLINIVPLLDEKDFI